MNKIEIAVIAVIVLGIAGLLFFGLDLKKSTETVPNTTASSTTSSNTTYTLADVSTHRTDSNCWMAINGKVYDVTSYIASGKHNSQISEGCGIDATALYEKERKHQSSEADSLLSSLEIGTLQ